jgi:hypothetical protein
MEILVLIKKCIDLAYQQKIIKTFKIIDKPVDSSNDNQDSNVDPAIVESKHNESESQKRETQNLTN